jgi:hypothetical protein
MKETIAAEVVGLVADTSSRATIPIYQGCKSISFTLFSHLKCDTAVNDVGIMEVYCSHSAGRTLVYHGPVNNSAYGTPTHVYESKRPFSFGPNLNLDFVAYDSQAPQALTTLTGRYSLRLTIEYDPI